jgi:hypothetical protein
MVSNSLNGFQRMSVFIMILNNPMYSLARTGHHRTGVMRGPGNAVCIPPSTTRNERFFSQGLNGVIAQ